MNTVLMVCAVVITVSFIIVAFFLTRTLLQMYRTAREAEMLLKGINQEFDLLKQFTGNLFSIAGKFSSPWFKAGSWIVGMVTSAIKNKMEKKASDKQL